MPISIRGKAVAIGGGLKRSVQRVAGLYKTAHLEIIFGLLVIANLFVDVGLILTLFMAFYFADRWDVFNKLITRKDNSYEQLQKALADNDSRDGGQPR